MEHGYHTCAIGKWHILSWPHDIGFDDYLIPRVHHIHSYQYYTHNGGPEFVPETKWSVEFEADEAIKRFDAWSKEDTPFFLYYNFSPHHMPLMDVPRKYLEMYDPEEVPLRPNVNVEQYFPDLEFSARVYRWDYRYYSLRLPYTQEVPDEYGIRHITANYLGLISWVDDVFGRLLDSLEENGLLDDTIFVFSADDHRKSRYPWLEENLLEGSMTEEQTVELKRLHDLVVRYDKTIPVLTDVEYDIRINWNRIPEKLYREGEAFYV